MKTLNDPKQKHFEYEACEEHGMFMDAGEFTDYKYEILLDIFRDAAASLKRGKQGREGGCLPCCATRSVSRNAILGAPRWHFL